MGYQKHLVRAYHCGMCTVPKWYVCIMVRVTPKWYGVPKPGIFWYAVPFFYIACGTQRTVFYFHFGTAYQKHLVRAYHCGMCTVPKWYVCIMVRVTPKWYAVPFFYIACGTQRTKIVMLTHTVWYGPYHNV